MTNTDATKLPLWVQEREQVLVHDQNVEWRDGTRPDYSYHDQVLQKQDLRRYAICSVLSK